MKAMYLLAGFILMCAAPLAFAAAAPTSVAIEKFAFAPREITIAPGTTVVWSNHDETPHTLIATDGSFVSRAMDTDDRYEHTFAAPGDYNYFCTLHPFMTGVVHVRADPAVADTTRKGG